MGVGVALGAEEGESLPESARLSDAQYAQIYDRVQARCGAERRRSRARVAALSCGSLCAVAAFVGVATSGEEGLSSPGARSKGGQSRAAATIAQPLIEAGCGVPGRRACQLGDTLIFSITGVAQRASLLAYARRVGAPEDGAIWYFGGDGGTPAMVEPSASTQVVPVGVRVAEPHEAGAYEVTAWVAELSASGPASGAVAPPQATRLTVTVSP